MSNSDLCESALLIAPYVLCELEPDAEERLESHLMGCADCSRSLEEVRATVRTIDQTVQTITREDLRFDREHDVVSGNGETSVELTVELSQDRSVGSAKPPRRGTRRSVLVQLVAAAALVLGFISGRLLPASAHQNVLRNDRSSVGVGLVSLKSTSWGTELTFHLENIPKTKKIGAWIRTGSSRSSRETICWWPLHGNERSGTFVASTNVSRGSIQALGISTGSNATLWWTPATSL
jgi:hypothetical protein